MPHSGDRWQQSDVDAYLRRLHPAHAGLCQGAYPVAPPVPAANTYCRCDPSYPLRCAWCASLEADAITPIAPVAEPGVWQVRLCLRLPYPPTSNNLYYTGKDGRRHMSQTGQRYVTQVAICVLEARKQLAEPLTGRLCVELDLHPPDKRRRDIANTEKCLMDSLVKAGVMRDDSQIDEVRLRRQAVQRGGCVVVCVSERREA